MRGLMNYVGKIHIYFFLHLTLLDHGYFLKVLSDASFRCRFAPNIATV